MISMDKNYQTRDGRKARVICVDREYSHRCPVIALVKDCDGYELVYSYNINGRYESDVIEHGNDLIEVVEKKWRAWTYEELPIGAEVRYKENTAIRMITACEIDMNGYIVFLSPDIRVWRDFLFRHYEVWLDGAWQRCGVLE